MPFDAELLKYFRPYKDSLHLSKPHCGLKDCILENVFEIVVCKSVAIFDVLNGTIAGIFSMQNL